ncbi:MAG: Stk1 family PASTA domain-containing Ser/Thr kinase [Candidatus Eremiobacterales bacterium]
MPETIYNNRYRLDAKVGEGGMAVVYRGYDLLLRRQVAVKVLRPQFAADDEFVQRFYQEAQAAAKLSHPNIVNTYDVGEVGDSHYIVQEFVGGETLAALIAREKKLPESAAIRYAMGICAALGAAHRGELLHRDIKPSNVLITPEDTVRVADFGIARAANAQTVTSQENVLASVPYGAPEHLTGQALCEASDLYSVGVVLYEMVTGKRPYDAETAMGVAMAHVNAPVPDPVAAGATISPQLREIIMRLLQKSPKDRYQTAGEALVALRACLGFGPDGEHGGSRNGETDTAVIRRRKAAADARRRWFAGLDESSPSVWNSRRAIMIASTIVALIIIAVIAVAMRQNIVAGPRVPDLTGKTTADAVAALHAAGFDDVVVKSRVDAQTAAGLVSGTEPASGLAVASGTAVILYMSAGPPTQGLSSVIGRDVKGAITFLSQKGYVVKLGPTVHSASVPKGLVAKTNPSPGAKLPVHGTVVLYPSGGPYAVSVPNLVDQSDADARKLVAKAGLTLKVSQVIPNVNIPPQTIMDQDPSGGSQAPPGSVITVEESGGPNSITVPNVVGGSVNDARGTLQQAGLTVGSVAQVEDATTTPGTVVSQNPQAGAQTGAGTAVDLYVAFSPAAPSTAPSAAPTANALPPIPSLVGMTLEDATAALTKLGYSVGHVTVLTGSPPNAKVVSTEPEPGATTPPGSTSVDIVLGPTPH